jgi:hypothetical protein
VAQLKTKVLGSGWIANKNFHESWDVLRAVPEPYHRWGDLVIRQFEILSIQQSKIIAD